MAGLVDILVIGALGLAVGFGRDDRGFAGGGERFDDALVGVIGLVGQQGVGPVQIMGLAGREQEGQRIAQRIDEGVDPGAQSAPAAPDGFVAAVFFRAPALCWWARTMVESIIAYSLSASAAKALNSRSHTPLAAQRLCRV